MFGDLDAPRDPHLVVPGDVVELAAGSLIPAERQLPRVVDNAAILDAETLARLNERADAVSEKYRCEGWLEHFVEDFMPAAEKLHEAGMHFMYHNHAYEFQRMADGRQVMDALLDAFPAELMGVIADTYWIQYAGMDVNKWLRDHADRLPCVHFKDLKPELFEDAPEGAFSLNRVFDRAAAAERLFGLRLDGIWMHVGTPDAIALAEEAIERSSD